MPEKEMCVSRLNSAGSAGLMQKCGALYPKRCSCARRLTPTVKTPAIPVAVPLRRPLSRDGPQGYQGRGAPFAMPGHRAPWLTPAETAPVRFQGRPGSSRAAIPNRLCSGSGVGGRRRVPAGSAVSQKFQGAWETPPCRISGQRRAGHKRRNGTLSAENRFLPPLPRSGNTSNNISPITRIIEFPFGFLSIII